MITKNVFQKATREWTNHLKPITILSKRENGRQPLVNSEKVLYDFDAITKTLCSSDKLPASADGVLISESILEFIEFKSGFKKKITKDNFDQSKIKCPKYNEPCFDYHKLMLSKLKAETAELISSIRTKAIDSYIILEKQIAPDCALLDENKRIKIKLTVVIDEEETDNIEDTLSELTDKETEPSNCFKQIKSSLKRLNVQKDALGHDYFYDEINVVSAIDFYNRIEKI